MDRKTFGKLVRVLRKEQDWTQHVLADRANLSCRTIEKIESGELKKLDYNILSRLADALELTTAERKEFFFAAIEIDNNEPIDAHGNHLVVRDHLISITRSVNIPAFVHDHFGDIIAANTAIITLLNVSQAMIDDYAHMPAGYNVMRFIFDPSLGYQRLVGERQWSSSARSNIQFFRSVTLRHRINPYFLSILTALKKYPSFRRYWQNAHLEEESLFNSEYYDYHHPTYGRLAYIANTSVNPTRIGDLYLATYQPVNAYTTDVFKNLSGAKDVVLLAPWPNKPIIQ